MYYPQKTEDAAVAILAMAFSSYSLTSLRKVCRLLCLMIRASVCAYNTGIVCVALLCVPRSTIS